MSANSSATNKSPKSTQTKLVVLSAPSGTGKSTLASMLLKNRPEFKLSISFTTRSPRGEEKNGSHYFFVSVAEFQKMISQNEFLEYALVFGKHYYGTSKSSVEKMLNAGSNVLFDIDVQGARALKKSFGKRCITIFILPPSIEELETRLKSRNTETPEAIAIRMQTARDELKAAPEFDYQIVNNDLEQTYSSLEKILRSEGCF